MANHRCAVLGKPVAHSLSPVLHNAAYRSLKLDDWLYDKHEVGEDDLDAFLKGLDSTWAGLSLTMPLKKTIQPYGVPENLWAKELKVANTAVFDWSVAADDPAWPNGKPGIKLYNTDVIGIQLAFDHANRELGEHHTASRSGTALIIGNGNTATSALAACCMMPEIGHIVVAARHPGKNTGLKPVAEKFVNVHNPYSEIECRRRSGPARGSPQRHAMSSTRFPDTRPTISRYQADALANAGTEPFSPDCCWTWSTNPTPRQAHGSLARSWRSRHRRRRNAAVRQEDLSYRYC